MTIVQAPESIDAVLTENTFGDILSDIAAAVTRRPRPRSLGVASATTGRHLRARPRLRAADRWPGNRESRGMLRSVALLLSHGLGRFDEAAALEAGGRCRAPRRPHSRSRRHELDE